MSQQVNPHVGNFPVEIQYTALDQDSNNVDLTGATSVVMVLIRPDGTSFQVAADFADGTGASGIARWITASANDLNMAGTWARYIVATGPAFFFTGSAVRFLVDP